MSKVGWLLLYYLHHLIVSNTTGMSQIKINVTPHNFANDPKKFKTFKSPHASKYSPVNSHKTHK